MPNYTRINITLPMDLLKQIDGIARENDRVRSAEIRRALRLHVRREQRHNFGETSKVSQTLEVSSADSA